MNGIDDEVIRTRSVLQRLQRCQGGLRLKIEIFLSDSPARSYAYGSLSPTVIGPGRTERNGSRTHRSLSSRFHDYVMNSVHVVNGSSTPCVLQRQRIPFRMTTSSKRPVNYRYLILVIFPVCEPGVSMIKIRGCLFFKN